jgi:hypothetical protein
VPERRRPSVIPEGVTVELRALDQVARKERIIEALETLRAEDKEGFAVLVQRRLWLDDQH